MAKNTDLKKSSAVVVYTGDGKGKTSAALGLTIRALGNNQTVAFIQFIKSWQVSEDNFLNTIKTTYKNKLLTIKGGAGFFKAGSLSAKNISTKKHKEIALETYNLALEHVKSGNFGLVVCDEINNAVHDGLLSNNQLVKLILSRNRKTSLCLTGRNFPKNLVKLADIVSDISKIKHHYDEGYRAIKGLDY